MEHFNEICKIRCLLEILYMLHMILYAELFEFSSLPKETICHIDLDCFFVSVALRTHPELIGKPVAITHSRVIFIYV